MTRTPFSTLCATLILQRQGRKCEFAQCSDQDSCLYSLDTGYNPELTPIHKEDLSGSRGYGCYKSGCRESCSSNFNVVLYPSMESGLGGLAWDLCQLDATIAGMNKWALSEMFWHGCHISVVA